MSKTILLVIFGIITGQKIFRISNSYRTWIVEDEFSIRYYEPCKITVEIVKTLNLIFLNLWRCRLVHFFWDTRYSVFFVYLVIPFCGSFSYKNSWPLTPTFCLWVLLSVSMRGLSDGTVLCFSAILSGGRRITTDCANLVKSPVVEFVFKEPWIFWLLIFNSGRE